MNAKIPSLLLLGSCLLSFAVHSAFAQGTAFTYQGQLLNGASPANGSYNLTFALFTNSAGGTALVGPVTNNGVAVTNGLFTVTIDFGAGPWDGDTNWLEIGVETNGGGSFTTLTPRQQFTPTPYAIFAKTASNLSGLLSVTQLSGTLLDAQLTHSAVTIDPGPGLSGGGKVGLGNTITLTNTGVLSVSGNADITASNTGGAVILADTATNADIASTIVKRDGSGNFSATTITLQGNFNLPSAGATAGIIYSGGATLIHNFGAQNLFAGAGAGNLTMSGPQNTGVGYEALLANTAGQQNTGTGAFALDSNLTGSGNTAVGFEALYYNNSGSNNAATGISTLFNNSTGSYNTASGYGSLYDNTSGDGNTAVGAYALSFNSNGGYNVAVGYGALGSSKSGNNNTAVGDEALPILTNGANNTAVGIQALNANTNGSDNTALGYQAGYYITGGFNNIDIGNTGSNTDSGIIRIGQAGNQTATYLTGTVYANGVALTSDRNAKENFTAINSREVLAKVIALPVTEWNYKTDGKTEQHIGPMAQDFQSAFGLNGKDGTHISVVDEGGVALAAIQGLNQRLEDRLKARDAEIAQLKQSVSELQATVLQLARNQAK